MWKNKATGERVGRIVSHDLGRVTLEDGSTHAEEVFFAEHEEDATAADDADIPPEGGEETTAGAETSSGSEA